MNCYLITFKYSIYPKHWLILKKLPQDSNTTIMLIWCLKRERFYPEIPNKWKCLLRCTKLLNVLYTVPFLVSFSWRCWWLVGEVFVNRTNYQGCQFDVHFIQCHTSTDILGIVNEFFQHVQNQFQNVYIPI